VYYKWSLDSKTNDLSVQALSPFATDKYDWLPAEDDIPYAQSCTFENYKLCRLKEVHVTLSNFTMRRLIKYSDDSVTEKIPSKMNMRYYWDSNQQFTGSPDDAWAWANFNKLKKIKTVYQQSKTPSFRYKYKPLYGNGGGWSSFINESGYGYYGGLANVYSRAFAAYINGTALLDYRSYMVKGDNNSTTINEERVYPTLYFTYEQEYNENDFDDKQPVHLTDVLCHLNFEVSYKSVWEFRNPRIDKLIGPKKP